MIIEMAIGRWLVGRGLLRGDSGMGLFDDDGMWSKKFWGGGFGFVFYLDDGFVKVWRASDIECSAASPRGLEWSFRFGDPDLFAKIEGLLK